MSQGWSFVAAGTVGTGSNPIAGLPAGVAAGDLLVIATTGAAVSAPFGYTTAVSAIGGATFGNLQVFYKIASASETSVSFATANTTCAVGMCAWRAPTGLDLAGTGNSAASGTSVSTLSLTTTAADDLVISFFGVRSGADTWTAPSGTTQRQVSNPTSSLCGFLVVDENQASASATTARTATKTVSTTGWGAVAVAFKAPSGGAVTSSGKMMLMF